ncbi:MAG: heparinase II/III family protein [Pseudomonadota bacterium]
MTAYGSGATAFKNQPEPRSIGHLARGRQLVAGNYLFSGHLVEGPGLMIWDLDPPGPAFEADIHGCLWLDDLAAVSDGAARKLAQDWVFGWIKRYGRGSGPGWSPDITGRRLIRWVNHAVFLLGGKGADSTAYFRSVGHQTRFLARCWSKTSLGLPRIEALTGLIYAGLSLQGMEEVIAPATRALGKACTDQISADGTIESRNPEELLEIFTLLNWAARALKEAGAYPDPAHEAAMEHIAPVLRTLRHVDGSLARFHGGGRGLRGRLEEALGTSSVRADPPRDAAMGYARLAAIRSSVILDQAPPPGGRAGYNAHASTLAFELTSGRRPVIVNCGSGRQFGGDWRRAGRATASHSALSLEGYSSSRVAASRRSDDAGDALTDIPNEVLSERRVTERSIRVQASHDGYRRTHGLTHMRTLELAQDGRELAGADLLISLSDADKALFDRKLDEVSLQGFPFAARFHLHPDVVAERGMGGAAISLTLPSGEVWVFRHDARSTMSLEASVFLERGRLQPRATQQIVLTGRALGETTRIRWSLAKAQESPLSVRDWHFDDPLYPED